MCQKICQVFILLVFYIVKFWIYSYNYSIRLETLGAGRRQFKFPTFFVFQIFRNSQIMIYYLMNILKSCGDIYA